MENQILSFNKFRAEIYERKNKTHYPNHSHAVKYIQETPKGKYSKEKILNHYVYKDFSEAFLSAEKWINNIKANIQSRQAEKEKRQKINAEVKASDFYKIGDIICNTWGWEQTNVNFYKVIKVMPKSILIQQVYSKIEEGSEESHGMACNVLPDPDNILKDTSITLRVYANGKLSNHKSYYYMHKWSGKSEYCSWYA